MACVHMSTMSKISLIKIHLFHTNGIYFSRFFQIFVYFFLSKNISYWESKSFYNCKMQISCRSYNVEKVFFVQKKSFLTEKGRFQMWTYAIRWVSAFISLNSGVCIPTLNKHIAYLFSQLQKNCFLFKKSFTRCLIIFVR